MNRAFFGGGISDTQRDFWMYDEENNEWLIRSSLKNETVVDLFGFNIGAKFYVGGGFPDSNELWEFNPNKNAWTQRANIPPAFSKYSSFSFTLKGKGYIGGGILENGDRCEQFYSYKQ